MTMGQIATAAALCGLILLLAAGSNVLLDRYSLAAEPPSGGACLGEDGAPRNWPWANAPTLWPKCAPEKLPAAPPAQGK